MYNIVKPINKKLSQLFGFSQDFSGDDHTLNLRCAFIQLVDLSITHELLDRVFSIKAVPAKDLNGISGALVSDVRSVAFCD